MRQLLIDRVEFLYAFSPKDKHGNKWGFFRILRVAKEHADYYYKAKIMIQRLLGYVQNGTLHMEADYYGNKDYGTRALWILIDGKRTGTFIFRNFFENIRHELKDINIIIDES